MNDKNYLVYDGECPFCAAASKYYSIREALGGLELVSMRDTGAVNKIGIPAEIDFGKGMILLLKNGEILQGEDAFRFLNQISEKRSILDKVAFPLFSSKTIMTFLYPIFVMFRRIALFFKGVSPKIARE